MPDRSVSRILSLSFAMLALAPSAQAKNELVNSNGWSLPVYFGKVERKHKFSQSFSAGKYSEVSAQVEEFRAQVNALAERKDINTAGRSRPYSYYKILDRRFEVQAAQNNPVYTKVGRRDVFTFNDEVEIKSQFIALSSQASEVANVQVRTVDLVLRNKVNEIVFEKVLPIGAFQVGHSGQDLTIHAGAFLSKELYGLLVERDQIPDLSATLTLNTFTKDTVTLELTQIQTADLLGLKDLVDQTSMLGRLKQACMNLLGGG